MEETVTMSLQRYEDMKKEILNLKKEQEMRKKEMKALNELFGEDLQFTISPEQFIIATLKTSK